MGSASESCRKKAETALRSAEFNRLEVELAERELELATLRAEVQRFEFLYLRTLGLRYAELDGLEAEIAELLAAAAPCDDNARTRAAQARAHARESEEAADWVGEPSEETPRFAPSEDLKKLYRRVAKSVHPDLTDEDRDRELREELMADANQAYAEGNTARLREILEAWQRARDRHDDGRELALERINHRLHQAKERLRTLASELETLKLSKLHQLFRKVEDGKRLGLDLLAAMAREIDSQIASARKRLRALRAARGKEV